MESRNINERLLVILNKVIQNALRVLAILMALVIVFGVVDVAWVFYKELVKPPRFMLTISDILSIFGAFMAVQYFMPHESSEWVYEFFALDWVPIIGIFALALGIWSLIRVSYDKIRNRR